MNNVLKDMGKVRRLCCLGLPSEILVPHLIDSICALLDAEAGVYYWFNGDGSFANIYTTSVEPKVIECLSDNHEAFYSNKVVFHLFNRALTSDDFGTFIDISPKFFDTDFYHEICLPLGCHHAIEGVVRVNGKVVGMVMVARARTGKAFTVEHRKQLSMLMPFISHGIDPSLRSVDFSLKSERQGLVILNGDLNIEYMCETAREILFFCNYESAFSSRSRVGELLDIPQLLKRLCLNLMNSLKGNDGIPPAHIHRNRWGEFSFKAYLLEGSETPVGRKIGLFVERRKPISLSIVKNLSELPLARRQSDVAFFVGLGWTNERIARELFVSRNTVRDHLEKIYSKAGVETREELIELLTA